MGWGDVSMNGGALRTPNIDRLAEEGARLTDFYVPAPICSSSRAALMTGRHPPWVGVPWNPYRPPNPEETFVAETLREAGYYSAALGKWHLGTEPEHMPTRRGFDHFWGFITGRIQKGWWEDDHPTQRGTGWPLIASALTSEALAFVDASPGPFFIYLSHRDPHHPYYEGTYAASVRRLDDSVGQLLDGLDARGLAENTLVIFTSDNGPVPPDGGTAHPYSGRKGSCREGGVRVPAAARWPARIPAGIEVDEVVSTLDLYPTFVALARGLMPVDRPYPGRDVTPVLTGEISRLGPGDRELIFWQSGGVGAIRSGKWKYLRPSVFFNSTRLFDLEEDPAERFNVISSHPEVAERLDDRMVSLARQ
jgi:arylsulfatase A-like enzyme